LTQKLWYLYLIECTDGSIYTGITVDVSARYSAHQKGTGARYTRSHPPARLLGFATFADRSSASKAEYQIKQLSAPEKRRFAAQCLTPLPETQTSESAIAKVT
jgi:putative endonuclease